MRFRRMTCLLVALMLLVSLIPVATNAAGIALAPGSHIRWIDRIGDLPEYARRFYVWLESNTDADGVLADPAKGLCVAGEYVYRLEVLSGCVTVGASVSPNEIQTAVLAATDDLAQQIMDYAFEVYGAFDRDHPEIFWLSGKSRCSFPRWCFFWTMNAARLRKCMSSSAMVTFRPRICLARRLTI